MNEYCGILIVDDEYIMRQGIKHMLNWEEEGFQIVGDASNGEEALVLIKMLHPHVILCDIVMPVLDGVEFTKIVHEQYPDIKIIMLSSYNDFDYVKSTLLNGAVDYILKPTINPEDLLKTLKSVASQISNLAIKIEDTLHLNTKISRYILGFDSELEVSNHKEIFPNQYYYILGINVKQIYSDYKKKANKIDSVLHAVSESVFIDIPNCIVNMNSEVIFVLINYDYNLHQDIMERMKEFVKKVAEIENQVFFVLSNPFYLISDIKKEYKESILALSPMKFYYEDKTLIQAEHRKIKEKEAIKFDYKQYNNLLSKNQIHPAVMLIKDYMELAVHTCQIDPYEIKSLLKNVIFTLTYTFEGLHIKTDKIKTVYFKQIDEVKSCTEFMECLFQLIKEIQELSSQNSLTLQEQTMEKILLYIKEHYNEEIDLGEVAEKFNFHYHYLSSYFSMHKGEGFSEYLNKIRMEKAVELLENNLLSIAEVSSFVGYSDQSYFCRVFKRSFGKTPTQYRKNYLSGR